MRAVWKFELPVSDSFSVGMSVGAQLLHVEAQRGVPCLWVLVETAPGVPQEARRFRLFGTGHAIPDDLRLKHVGTYQLAGGDFVGHVFEEFQLGPDSE